MNSTQAAKAKAKADLILYHGINAPTERQIILYVLYGEKSLNRREK